MMTMHLTHKERLRRAIHREQVDRLPSQISYTKDMQVLLAAHFNVPLGDLPFRFDNHLVRIDLTYPERIEPDTGRALRLVGCWT